VRLRVSNFQSLGAVDIEVEGLTVLVGPSNRGKSALIRAIEAALFNRPGDEFVRVGAKTASVDLQHAPGLSHVLWTKTRGKTVYTLDGQTFGKVGGGTPPAVTDAGYRDVWIGDKDRKRGEYLRPQISRQFPGGGLFLLDRSGAFVSDVLGAISRHAVLLTAQGRATGDQRTAKQRLGLRQTDLAAATAQLAALTDVPVLAQRVAALRAAYAAHQEAQARVDRAKALLAWRAVYRPLAAVALPEAVVVPEHLGWREHAARPRVDQRARLQTFLTTPLPAATVVPPDLDIRAAKARGLTTHRRPLAAFVAATLPAPVTIPASLDDWRVRGEQLRLDVRRRLAALDMLHRCETAVRATTVEAEVADAAVAEFLASTPLCPTCGRPLED
jgi:hypothetical protein